MARGNRSSGRYRDEEPRRRYADDSRDEEEYEDEEYRRPRPRKRKRRKRRSWPALLLGCLGGILVAIILIAVLVLLAISRATGSPIQFPGTGSSSGTGTGTSSGGGNSAPQLFHKTDVQPLSPPVTSVGQIQVQNQVGDVTITTDPTVQTVKVTTVKTVKAANESDAQAEFGKMNVQAQTTSTTNGTLTVTATVPGVIGNNTSDTIAITIALPPNMLSNGSAAPMLNITTTVGNVQVSGLNGLMMIKDTIGNVTVQQAQLFAGSHLQTSTGDVTFSGSIDTTTNPQANYKFQSEVGNLNVTLPAATNVTLDANTNVGSLHSDFPIAVQSSGNSANYYGPLAPGTSPATTLVLDVGSGNIALQKGQ